MASDHSEEFRNAIRAVLVSDWDLHGTAGAAHAVTAYDIYLPPLCDLLNSGATESQLVDWLHQREQETMCFPSLGTQRLRRVARKLLAVKV